jgi:prepilin-type processing-associated H-X9-DG protein
VLKDVLAAEPGRPHKQRKLVLEVGDVDGTTCNLSHLNDIASPHCYRNQTYNYGFKSRHPGGANFAMADGSVRFIKDSVNIQAYRGLGTRAGAEVISADSY